MSLQVPVTFDFGNEYGPDTPSGADRFRVQPDGTFVFEVRKAGRVLRTRTGTVDAAMLAQIARELAEAHFPQVPTHARPPGGGYVAITRTGPDGDERASMLLSAALAFPGYGSLLKRTAEWTKCLRGDSTPPLSLKLD